MLQRHSAPSPGCLPKPFPPCRFAGCLGTGRAEEAGAEAVGYQTPPEVALLCPAWVHTCWVLLLGEERVLQVIWGSKRSSSTAAQL